MKSSVVQELVSSFAARGLRGLQTSGEWELVRGKLKEAIPKACTRVRRRSEQLDQLTEDLRRTLANQVKQEAKGVSVSHEGMLPKPPSPRETEAAPQNVSCKLSNGDQEALKFAAGTTVLIVETGGMIFGPVLSGLLKGLLQSKGLNDRIDCLTLCPPTAKPESDSPKINSQAVEVCSKHAGIDISDDATAFLTPEFVRQFSKGNQAVYVIFINEIGGKLKLFGSSFFAQNRQVATVSDLSELDAESEHSLIAQMPDLLHNIGNWIGHPLNRAEICEFMRHHNRYRERKAIEEICKYIGGTPEQFQAS